MLRPTHRLALCLFALLPACDAGPPLSEIPRQVVDPGVTAEQAQEMLTLADLDDALEVADFHIYLPDRDFAPATPRPLPAPLPRPEHGLDNRPVTPDGDDPWGGFHPCFEDSAPPEPFETVCGACGCTNSGRIVCIDYLCDPTQP